MLDRRQFLKQGVGAAAVGLALPGCDGAGDLPLATQSKRSAASQPAPWAGLARSLPEEHAYAARVEGRLPERLRGTLFRNGPGLFERGGARKRCLLDGDGMIHRFALGAEPGAAHYRNRFTRTEKFREEEARGAYHYATWTTQAPGGRLANLFANRMGNQAGVSVVEKQGRLFAFDESFAPHELDPTSLETLGPSPLAATPERAFFSAHSKSDPRSGEWLHFGLEYGRDITLHLNSFRGPGEVAWRRSLTLPRYCYVHDWFVSERHVVFNIHPAEIDLWPFLSGARSLAGSMRWAPERGNLWWVVPRGETGDVVAIESDPAWMWHSVNAYERDGEIIADYVGYDAPVHFLGEDAALFSVMRGERGASSAGTLRRAVIDPARRRIRHETLLAEGSSEFPALDPSRACSAHRYAYLTRARGEELFGPEVLRVDTRSGATRSFDFGPGHFCHEPVFAPDPAGKGDIASGHEPGWLLVLVHDARRERSQLAVLDAEHLEDGPLARVHLEHHTPVTFHGWWQPESPGPAAARAPLA